MSVDERTRHEIYEKARESWGARAADGLMELLPPAGLPDLATKQDLALLGSDVALLGSELRGEIGVVRGEIDGLRTEMNQEFALVRGEIDTLRHEFRAELQRELRDQTTRILTFVLPTMLSGVGLAFAAAKIG